MKKLAALFTGIAVLVCGIVMTGCDNDSKNTIQEAFAPKNTWIREEITISGGTNLYCYIYYNDTGSPVSVGNTNIKTGGNAGSIGTGMTVVLRLNSSSNWNSLTSSNIAVKTIPLNDSSNQISGEDGNSYTLTDGLWTTLGIARSFYTKTTSAPSYVTDTYDVLSDLTEESWKSVLAALLTNAVINKLLA